MHIHLFSPGDGTSPDRLSSSSIASERLRLSPAFECARAAGIDVSIGNVCPDQTTTALIGKIGVDVIQQRGPQWLDQICQLTQKNKKTVLDYTDHHLSMKTPMTPFYTQAIASVTKVVTPTETLATALVDHQVKASTETIGDLLEYPANAPSKVRDIHKPIALWFGHPSNAAFLARYLDDHAHEMAKHRLLIVSAPATWETLKRFSFRNRPNLEFMFKAWSKQMMVKASQVADYCIIPSDTTMAKRFASSNRLVTALALGLPTVATAIPSYIPFRNFFAEEGSEAASKLMADPALFHHMVENFQATQLSEFTLSTLIKKWHKVLF